LKPSGAQRSLLARRARPPPRPLPPDPRRPPLSGSCHRRCSERAVGCLRVSFSSGARGKPPSTTSPAPWPPAILGGHRRCCRSMRWDLYLRLERGPHSRPRRAYASAKHDGEQPAAARASAGRSVVLLFFLGAPQARGAGERDRAPADAPRWTWLPRRRQPLPRWVVSLHPAHRLVRLGWCCWRSSPCTSGGAAQGHREEPDLVGVRQADRRSAPRASARARGGPP